MGFQHKFSQQKGIYVGLRYATAGKPMIGAYAGAPSFSFREVVSEASHFLHLREMAVNNFSKK